MQTSLAVAERHALGVARAAWWAAAIKSAGTLFYNVTTFRAMHAALLESTYHKLVWRPGVLGSTCFLVSGAVAYRASARHDSLPARGSSGWSEPAINLLGCVLFGISAVVGLLNPATGAHARTAAANWATSAGAACFLVCAGATLLLAAR